MTNISQILDSSNVLLPFTKDYGRKLHASEASRIMRLPQRTVARKLDFLQKLNLLGYRKDGRNKYFFLDLRSVSSFALLEMVECYKEISFLVRHPQLSLLLNELAKNYSFILFGSYAKDKAKEESDVDVIIFGRKSEAVRKTIARYPFEVNAHYITFALFEKKLKEGWPLAKEIAKDHVLFGEKEKIIQTLINYYKK